MDEKMMRHVGAKYPHEQCAKAEEAIAAIREKYGQSGANVVHDEIVVDNVEVKDLYASFVASNAPRWAACVGVDLASGPDRSVAIAVQRDENGALRVVDCEELPPDTVSVVGYGGRDETHAADALACAFAVEDDVPVPKGCVTGRIPLGFSDTVPRTRSSLSVAYVPTFLGDVHNGYRLRVTGPSGEMIYGVGFGWSSKEEAGKHMSAACSEYWRRHG